MEKINRKQALFIDKNALFEDIVALIFTISAPLYYTWINADGSNMPQWLMYTIFAVCGGGFVKTLTEIKKDLKRIREDRI